MAGAKRELQEAIGDLQESQAELVLSLVHYLRATERGTISSPAGDPSESLETWARALVLLLRVEDPAREEDLEAILKQLDGASGDWSNLSEPVLARDWERPEEDEAWADL